MTAHAPTPPALLALRRYGPSPGSHAHAHFQLLVGLDGALELEVDGRGARVGAGDALLVAPGQRHDFFSARGSTCLVLDSHDPLWADCAPRPARTAPVNALAGYLATALAEGRPLAALHGPSLLLEAWQPPRPSTRARRRLDWLALARWAQARLDGPLDVPALAREALLGPSQFARRCREETGLAPQAWLQRLRLARARQLRDQGLAVKEVARRTGYRSPSALTAALRRNGLAGPSMRDERCAMRDDALA